MGLSVHGARRPTPEVCTSWARPTRSELLTLAGLIGGTIEYREIIRPRGGARRLDEELRLSQAAGLSGLVRVFLATD